MFLGFFGFSPAIDSSVSGFSPKTAFSCCLVGDFLMYPAQYQVDKDVKNLG